MRNMARPLEIVKLLTTREVMRDSFMVIGKGHAIHEDGEDGLMRHISKTGRINEDDLRKITSSNPNGHSKFDRADRSY